MRVMRLRGVGTVGQGRATRAPKQQRRGREKGGGQGQAEHRDNKGRKSPRYCEQVKAWCWEERHQKKKAGRGWLRQQALGATCEGEKADGKESGRQAVPWVGVKTGGNEVWWVGVGDFWGSNELPMFVGAEEGGGVGRKEQKKKQEGNRWVGWQHVSCWPFHTALGVVGTPRGRGGGWWCSYSRTCGRRATRRGLGGVFV